MSGVYTVQFSAFASGTAAMDLFEIVGHASKPYVVLGWKFGQTSDVGDSQEEILNVFFKSGQTTAGSGAGSTTPTPVPTDSSMAAAGFTARCCDLTQASAGTIVTHSAETWNERMPCEFLATQEQQYVMAAGRRCTLGISAPADSITLTGTIWVQEIG